MSPVSVPPATPLAYFFPGKVSDQTKANRRQKQGKQSEKEFQAAHAVTFLHRTCRRCPFHFELPAHGSRALQEFPCF